MAIHPEEASFCSVVSGDIRMSRQDAKRLRICNKDTSRWKSKLTSGWDLTGASKAADSRGSHATGQRPFTLRPREAHAKQTSDVSDSRRRGACTTAAVTRLQRHGDALGATGQVIHRGNDDALTEKDPELMMTQQYGSAARYDYWQQSFAYPSSIFVGFLARGRGYVSCVHRVLAYGWWNGAVERPYVKVNGDPCLILNKSATTDWVALLFVVRDIGSLATRLTSITIPQRDRSRTRRLFHGLTPPPPPPAAGRDEKAKLGTKKSPDDLFFRFSAEQLPAHVALGRRIPHAARRQVPGSQGNPPGSRPRRGLRHLVRGRGQRPTRAARASKSDDSAGPRKAPDRTRISLVPHFIPSPPRRYRLAYKRSRPRPSWPLAGSSSMTEDFPEKPKESSVTKAGDRRTKMCMDRAAVPVKRVWLGLAARLGLRRKTGMLSAPRYP
ncbi:hypothetical protein HU200_029578 [Digitaria exilis]|uniref:Uncharacterized protein n=1 Tax=Digitaria exilis TaxID=1010633 RepID=A0A835ERM8_9POAL|nr:hypothetical protein HU200_029578 [Digitaria exilis]